VALLARGGARLVQLRTKGETDRALLERAREAAAAARQGGRLLVVNDRAGVAVTSVLARASDPEAAVRGLLAAMGGAR